MKVVVSGDWHGDWHTLGVSRFDEVAAAAHATADHAIRIQAGLYVFDGDLAETEGPGMLRTLELAITIADKLNHAHIPSLWLPGNHDVIEDGKCTSTLSPLRDVPGATLADYPTMHLLGQRVSRGGEGGRVVRVACLPFTPRTHDYNPELWVEQQVGHYTEGPHPDLVVGHLMLEGIGPGSETRDMPRGRNVFFPIDRVRHTWPNAVLVNGHYHTAQVFRGVHLPGSLVRLMQVEASNTPSFLEIEV